MEPEDPTVAVIDDPEAGLSGVAPDEAAELAGEDPAAPLEAMRDAVLAEYDRQTREMVDAMEQEVREAEDHYLTLKAQTAEQKKIFEGMAAELRQLIRKRRECRGKPPEPTLFDGSSGEVVDAEFTVIPEGEVPAELWRQYPLDRWTAFGLSEKQVEKLQSAGLSTVGELADYTRPNDSGYCKKLTDIKGVGKALSEKVDVANTAFWAEWNRVLAAKFAGEKGVLRVEGPGDESTEPLPDGGPEAAPDGDQPGAAAGEPGEADGDQTGE